MGERNLAILICVGACNQDWLGPPDKIGNCRQAELACELYAPSAQRLGRLDFKNENKPRPDCLPMPGRVMISAD